MNDVATPRLDVSDRSRDIHRIAARLFSEHSFKGTSMRQLAEEVGLEVSSLYSHIKNKEEILVNLCQFSSDQFSHGLQLIEDSDATPYVKLCRVIDLHLELALNYPSTIIVFNDEWRHLKENALARFLQSRRDYEMRVIALIQQAQKEQDLKGLPSALIFHSILALTQSIYRASSSEEAQQVKEHIKTILLRGIKRQTP